MFSSSALDVSIGIVLVFLLVSVFLTALTEIIESTLKTRAADLERAIGQMLNDPQVATNALGAFYDHPLIFALFKGSYEPSRRSRFFGRETGGKLPSYIPRDLFSTVVMDLERASSVSPTVQAMIDTYRRLYGDNVATLKVNLESWYDGVMDRAAGWYKRRTQKLLFWLGLVLAIVLNINPILIAQDLAASPAKREMMVTIADQSLKDRAGIEAARSEAVRQLDQSVREVGLPMGWNDFAIGRSFPRDRILPNEPGQPPVVEHPGVADWTAAILMALVGWAITAVAATLGAPFWFDLLNKMMVIRATVKPKEKSPDEASEDRAAKPAASAAAGLATAGTAAGASGDGAIG